MRRAVLERATSRVRRDTTVATPESSGFAHRPLSVCCRSTVTRLHSPIHGQTVGGAVRIRLAAADGIDQIVETGGGQPRDDATVNSARRMFSRVCATRKRSRTAHSPDACSQADGHRCEPIGSAMPSPVQAMVLSTVTRHSSIALARPAVCAATCVRRVHLQQLAVMAYGAAAGLFDLQHHFQGLHRPVNPGAICLVDDEDVGDLEDARFDRLDFVAHARALPPPVWCGRCWRFRLRPGPPRPSRR